MSIGLSAARVNQLLSEADLHTEQSEAGTAKVRAEGWGLILRFIRAGWWRSEGPAVKFSWLPTQFLRLFGSLFICRTPPPVAALETDPCGQLHPPYSLSPTSSDTSYSHPFPLSVLHKSSSPHTPSQSLPALDFFSFSPYPTHTHTPTNSSNVLHPLTPLSLLMSFTTPPTPFHLYTPLNSYTPSHNPTGSSCSLTLLHLPNPFIPVTPLPFLHKSSSSTLLKCLLALPPLVTPT